MTLGYIVKVGSDQHGYEVLFIYRGCIYDDTTILIPFAYF